MIGVKKSYGGALQPVNTDGFFVSRLFLQTNIGVIAGFDHLLAGLGKRGFIPIRRRHRGDARREKGEAQQKQKDIGKRAEPRSVLCEEKIWKDEKLSKHSTHARVGE